MNDRDPRVYLGIYSGSEMQVQRSEVRGQNFRTYLKTIGLHTLHVSTRWYPQVQVGL